STASTRPGLRTLSLHDALPISHEARAAVRARALRPLVLVMREDEILAAAVNVDRLAEMRLGHRRALDVPTGPAAPPRAVPSDDRSEEHTSELQSRENLVCRLLL